MTVRPHLIALTLAVGVTAVAGCGSSTDAGSSPTSTGTSTSATSSTSTEPSTSTSSAPTPSTNGTAAGAPGVPEPARQHTKAGAIAFANYYTDKVNALGLKPKKGVLEPLSLKTCKTCKNFIETIKDNVRDNTRFDGKQMVRVRTFSPYTDSSRPSVWVVMKSPEVHIVDANGAVVQSFPNYHTAALVFHLTWTPKGWQTKEAKGDESVRK